MADDLVCGRAENEAHEAATATLGNDEQIRLLRGFDESAACAAVYDMHRGLGPRFHQPAPGHILLEGFEDSSLEVDQRWRISR